MIAINPNSIKTISLSSKERRALLEHSQAVERHIIGTISNSPSGRFSLLMSEFELFLTALRYETANAKTPKLQKIFGTLYNRLSMDFAFTPIQKEITTDIQEHLQGKDFKSIEHLNAELKTSYDKRNSDPEMGNLSPNQVSSLIYINWDDENCPMKFNKNLTPEDLKLSRFFNNTRLFLKTLIELSDEDTATTTGNLNRKLVKFVFDKLDIKADYRDTIIRYNKVLNEEDVFPLHIIRIVCEAGELIHKRSKKIVFKKNYHNLLSDENAGELYWFLFRAFFEGLNLGCLDRYPKATDLQETIGYSFYRLSTLCNEYKTIEELYRQILLPKVIGNIEKTDSPIIDKSGIIKTRIIKPLEEFGLVECQRKGEKYYSEIEKVKKTELFDRFMKFRI